MEDDQRRSRLVRLRLLTDLSPLLSPSGATTPDGDRYPAQKEIAMTAKTARRTTLLGLVLLLLFAVVCYLVIIWTGCGGASDLGSFVDKVRDFHTPQGCQVG